MQRVFFVSCLIGPSILFTLLIRVGIKNQCSDEQVCSYKSFSCISDQWKIVDTVIEGEPSGLNEKFSNGTSTMDINDRYFDDLDLDDEADNHLPKVSMMLVRLLLSLIMIFLKNEDGDWRYASLKFGKVVFEQSTFGTDEEFAADGETVGNILSPLSTSNTTPVLAAIVSLVVKVGDDLPSPPPVIEVGGNSSSSSSVVEVGDDSSSVPLEIFTSPSVDVYHQDKEKRVVIGEEEMVAPKRGLEEEGTSIDSRGVKKSRMALPQETSESVPTSPIMAQDPLPDSSNWMESINIGSHQD
ncbi:hypothetical protein Adt_04902 [Abeliophyllum distichum]|uniref:Uncharacterized protein n=1 Tax=Abeliophyllum distichum TaxID=126358 RepID=A0ABD1V2L8_9LAMI